MTDKKPLLADMGVELVEFDGDDNKISTSVTPLGHFLHEGPATEEEMQMTSQLVAFAPR